MSLPPLRPATVLTALVATGALVAVPAPASAATVCDFGSGVLEVRLQADGDRATLDVLSDGTIRLTGSTSAPITCQGGTPTVTNTNAITVANTPGMTDNKVFVLGTSDFAPGANTVGENGGDPEIEIFVNLNNAGGNTELVVSTPAAGGAISLGTGGINPNAFIDEVEPDADIFPTNVPAIRGLGQAGDDRLDAFGGRGTGAPLTADLDLDGQGGNDLVRGGEGHDVLRGGPGNDLVVGLAGNDLLLTGAGIDQAIGGEGDDHIVAGPPPPGAINVLSGDDGNDTIVPATAADIVDGGNGVDTVAFGQLEEGVDVDLASGASTVVRVESLVGTPFDDVIRGDGQDNNLDGREGNDLLVGRGGNDTLLGGSGDDRLLVRDGGHDHAACGPGIDTVVADPPGTDTLLDCETTRFPDDRVRGARASARSPQRLVGGTLRIRSRVKAVVEPLRATTSGRVRIAGRVRFALTPRRVALARGDATTLTQRVKGTPAARGRAHRQIRRALASGRVVRAHVTVRFRDEAGNLAVKRLRVRVRR